MICVILAGGKGTRLSEETYSKPKALVNIGTVPIISHIMSIYIRQGFTSFVVLGGYQFDTFLESFNALFQPDGFDGTGFVFHSQDAEIRLVNTGEDACTFERLVAVQTYLGDAPFMLTYCDGLCSVDLKALLESHKASDAVVTVTAVRPEPRFGVLTINENGDVIRMNEKNRSDAPLINGGFMVIQPELFSYAAPGRKSLERDVLPVVASDGRMHAYIHEGFWQCMDTLYEKDLLCSMAECGEAPWLKNE